MRGALVSNEARKMVPFSIGNGSSEDGPRLGGAAPAGVCPSTNRLKYFLTSPIEPGLMMSVFVDPAFAFGDGFKRVVDGGGVEVHFHPPTTRGLEPTAWDSELSPHPLVLGTEAEDVEPQDDDESSGDWQEDEVEEPYSSHKLRGVPFLVEQGEDLDMAVRGLLGKGFYQCLQIDFPGHEDGDVSGTWPFGTGLFHVLIRRQRRDIEWRCFWQP